jgi:FkbM family methyltransferase
MMSQDVRGARRPLVLRLRAAGGRAILRAARRLTAVGETLGAAPRSADEEIHRLSCEAWFAADGDASHRLDYDLSPASTVLDVGGHEGQWAADIFTKYDCRVVICEPYEAFASRIRRRFSHNDKVQVFTCGLSGVTQIRQLGVLGNASSVHKESAAVVDVRLQRAADFFREHQLDTIDLMKINIEGGEYELLEHMIEADLVRRVGNIQVQFHDFFPDARQRMHAIQAGLSRTHVMTYQYEFIWENWALRPEHSFPGS